MHQVIIEQPQSLKTGKLEVSMQDVEQRFNEKSKHRLFEWNVAELAADPES